MMAALLDRLAAVASQTPQATAVTAGAGETSYARLYADVQKVGSLLAAQTRPGDRVMLALGNSLEYIVALYACWYAGLIVVPVDANAKEREIEQVVLQAKPMLVISSSRRPHAQAVAARAGPDYLDIGLLLNYETEMPDIAPRAVDEALIVYTSGTSGNPKGVVLTHGNLLANARAIVGYLGLTDSDSALLVLPLHYSYGNSVLLTHLYVGARLVLGKSMMYPQLVVDQLRESRVSGFAGVPTTMLLLLDRTDFANDPPALRYITQAGGPMGRRLTARLRDALAPATQLFVMYGQTEATARLTWLPPDRLDEKLGSVGIPVDGVVLRIVNRFGQPNPTGKPGEVLASGPNIMSRYWDNPSGTDAVLRDGWLHTGDIGYLDRDGFLFVQGRASEMIKTGAYRVSPAEIEELVTAAPFVEEAAACGVPDEILGQVIVLFLVGAESASRTREIFGLCRQALSSYKLPRRIVWRNALPKTLSGKVRKHLLVDEFVSLQAGSTGGSRERVSEAGP
jgi:long-chain acyl-CoA synthetase